jgi:hypothetical protein
MMRDLVFWTWVVGGAPLALALIRWAVGWLREATRFAMAERAPAAGKRSASDSSLRWTHA